MPSSATPLSSRRSSSSATSGSTTPSRRRTARTMLMPAAACRRSSMRSRRRRKNQRVGSRLRRRKISTKLDLLGNLIATVDVLIISGAMANTFLAAQGKRPASLCERDLVGTAREILTKASSRKCEILLPVDAVVAQKFEANAPSHVVPVDAVGSDDMILDIGRLERAVRSIRAGTLRAAATRWRRSMR